MSTHQTVLFVLAGRRRAEHAIMGAKGSKSKKLTKEDLEFLLSNTNFTKRQIKQWYKGFMVSVDPNFSL